MAYKISELSADEYGLRDRDLKILILIVEAYIYTGEPVGSRLLSKHERVDLSPATLRNIMTDLTDKNLIAQPHASAGRIPTDLGYRVYVNQKVNSDEMQYTVDEIQTVKLKEKKLLESTDKIDSYFQFTAEYLSDETQMMSFVTSPYPQTSVFEKLEFIPISEHKVVVILVTIAGMVIHKTVHTREKVDFDVLHKIVDYINVNFSHCLLKDIKVKLCDIFNEETDLKDYRMPAVIRLCRKAFSLEESGQLYISGFENILKMRSDVENSQVSDFLKMIANHGMIIDFLQKHSKDNTVTVLIGQENNMTVLNHFSVVSAPYTIGSRSLGNISVIGPKRMYYDKVFSIIRNTADRVSDELYDYTNLL